MLTESFSSISAGPDGTAACHLAAGVPTFAYMEWDDAFVPGLDASGYSVEDGVCRVPDTLGFGLSLDEALFQRVVTNNGFTVPTQTVSSTRG